jgi:hypothetical protein
MRDAWTNLARTGDPGWPPVPVTKLFGREMTLADDPIRARLESIAQ